MSETEKLPPAWRKLFERAQIPSQAELASRTGLSKGTVNRLVWGKGRPEVETVRKAAAELSDGDTDTIWEAVGTGHRDFGDFDLSEVSDELALLSPVQRRSLLALVRSMADPSGKRLKAPEDASDVSDLSLPDAETGPS